MFKNLFKSKIPSLIKTLTYVCMTDGTFDYTYPSVHYKAKSDSFVVYIECAMREYKKKDKYILSVRRKERIIGRDLEGTLRFAIKYVESPDAFKVKPESLPEGITMKVVEYNRKPRNFIK